MVTESNEDDVAVLSNENAKNAKGNFDQAEGSCRWARSIYAVAKKWMSGILQTWHILSTVASSITKIRPHGRRFFADMLILRRKEVC